jgi:hypothetical protein
MAMAQEEIDEKSLTKMCGLELPKASTIEV